jgi:hypothetical protein
MAWLLDGKHFGGYTYDHWFDDDPTPAAGEEGLQKGKLEMALKMKSRGIAAEQIAEDTGLSLKQIEEL